MSNVIPQDPYAAGAQPQDPYAPGAPVHPGQNYNMQAMANDFHMDANHRLGRANGNTYQRIAGVEGVHDGQLMVRLKKKRFIVLEYTPDPAVTKECNSPTCHKTACPKLLFDSDPTEPPSLYLRSGLCFACQRSVNEKRRSNSRKSSSDTPQRSAPAATPSSPQFAGNKRPYAYLSPSAVLVDGPIDGARPADANYGYSEIGRDFLPTLQSLTGECRQLVTEAAKGYSMTDRHAMEYKYQRALTLAKKSVYQLTQWKQSWDAALAAADHHHAMIAAQNAAAAPDLLEPKVEHDDSLPEAKAELETFAV